MLPRIPVSAVGTGAGPTTAVVVVGHVMAVVVEWEAMVVVVVESIEAMTITREPPRVETGPIPPTPVIRVTVVPPIPIIVVVGIRVAIGIGVSIIRVIGGIIRINHARRISIRVRWRHLGRFSRLLRGRRDSLASDFPASLKQSCKNFVRHPVLLQSDNLLCAGIVGDS
jgi:hypothetical protein